MGVDRVDGSAEHDLSTEIASGATTSIDTTKLDLASDYITYIIPRDNGEVVLGGTVQKNDL